MQRHRAEIEAERLVNLHQTVRKSAQDVYDITVSLVDASHERMSNPRADWRVDQAFDALLRADKLIELGRILLSLKTYPRYEQVRMFQTNLRAHSREQRARLDDHLRVKCLKESVDLPRRDAAKAAIDGLVDIYESRENLFYELYTNHVASGLSKWEVRVLDGVIESSLDFAETMADVLIPLTGVVQR